jgi:phosphoribosylformylglycinamidine cyclo-ligase
MPGETYISAGVDLDGMDALKERIKALSQITHGPEVLGSGGGFAGVYRLPTYKAPVMVASTDGVGTKLKIASHLGHWESLGIDLVNLNANDVLTWGARPLFFLDYISVSVLDAQSIEILVRGMSWACHEMGCALISGETAQMPGLHLKGDFDLAGFLVGVVEQDQLLDYSLINEGDVLIGVPSSGLHTNGYSLVRRIFRIDDDPSVLYKKYAELHHTLGEELLIPHRAYYPLLEPILTLVKGMTHITGGGMPAKVPVNLPSGLTAIIRLGSWDVPDIFPLIQRTGEVGLEEMLRVFNMGLGMILVSSPENVQAIQKALPEVKVVGEVAQQKGDDRVLFET